MNGQRVAGVLLAAVVGLSAVASASAGGGALYGGYRYDGRKACPTTATVSLTGAVVHPGKWSHAAVWAGVFAAGSQAWVQAGVTQDGTGPAYAYLEWATTSGAYKLVRLADASTVTLTLHRNGNAWTLTVAGRTATVRLGAQTRCFAGAESEDWGSRNVVRGVVRVDGGTPFRVSL
jgi:hypothetical protein